MANFLARQMVTARRPHKAVDELGWRRIRLG
jgi:hypothetical protein